MRSQTERQGSIDHSTLSIRKRRKHIPANQRLYINEAKAGKGKPLLFHLFTRLEGRADGQSGLVY